MVCRIIYIGKFDKKHRCDIIHRIAKVLILRDTSDYNVSKLTFAPQRRTINAGISLTPDLIKQLEDMAGDVPKSRFVQRLIEHALREREIEARK
jgi:hypothetical protein